MEHTKSCRVPAPGAAPGCDAGPLARYAWLLQALAALVRRHLNCNTTAPRTECTSR